MKLRRKAQRIAELEAEVKSLSLKLRLMRTERDRARAVASLLADREPAA